MDYKVLYRKYRPDNFENIIDQDFIIKTLKNAINKQKIAHAYIFSGPRGTGKTTTAKVFAKSLNCLNYSESGPCGECDLCKSFAQSPDIIEIDAASNNGVDEIRELINNVKLAPSMSKYKVYIIDEVHMLTANAFNALLLTLEEPPSNVVFILATTNVECIPITILSRCQRFDFHQISLPALVSRLKYVSEEEKIQISDEAITEIANLAEGGMRDALGILDQLSSQYDNISLDIVQNSYNIVSTILIEQLNNAFLTNDYLKIIEIIDEIKSKGYDYKNVAKKIINIFMNMLIANRNEYSSSNISKLKKAILEINQSINDANIYVSPYILLEAIMLATVDSEVAIETSKEDKKVTNNVNRVDSNYFPGNNLNQVEVEKDEKIPVTEESKETEFSRDDNKNYFPGNNFEESDYEKLKNIRINNCFVNPQKLILEELKEKWNSFVNNINDSQILSVLVDTNVVAASDLYVIITSGSKGTAELVNLNINKVDEVASEYFNKKLKLVAITDEEWIVQKKGYIQNLKNKKTYSLIEEDDIQYTEEENDELADIASEIFSEDKIEFN
ncbi:MAG: DNA polymerase III subunit gamma/tau [Bacilli bacterium]|nr:DNA polymerase III subunit gamma/tau [Bacilli bacterium]